MAASKKAVKPVAKTAETVKAETAETPKAETKKSVAAAKAETEKKASAPKAAETKAPVKKAVEKTAAVKTVKKAERKTSMYVQFSGKSYSQEELLKMAEDVWKYDLKQKVRALASIELYVKPEENIVYYVMNQEFTGSFYI